MNCAVVPLLNNRKMLVGALFLSNQLQELSSSYEGEGKQKPGQKRDRMIQPFNLIMLPCINSLFQNFFTYALKASEI
jgi:hypothetical protein